MLFSRYSTFRKASIHPKWLFGQKKLELNIEFICISMFTYLLYAQFLSLHLWIQTPLFICVNVLTKVGFFQTFPPAVRCRLNKKQRAPESRGPRRTDTGMLFGHDLNDSVFYLRRQLHLATL